MYRERSCFLSNYFDYVNSCAVPYRGVEGEETSDEEREWLEAIESGDIEVYERKKAERNPTLLTARQVHLSHIHVLFFTGCQRVASINSGTLRSSHSTRKTEYDGFCELKIVCALSSRDQIAKWQVLLASLIVQQHHFASFERLKLPMNEKLNYRSMGDCLKLNSSLFIILS